METDPLDRDKLMSKDVAVEIRKGFVKKVYGILTVQLMLTVAVAAPITMAGPIFVRDHVWMMWGGLGIYIAMSCVAICCRDLLRTFPQNYIILGTLTLGMSLVVGCISAMYTWQSVILAAGLTSLIFLGLTVYAWTTKTDFTGFGPYLFCFAMVLLLFGLTISILSVCGIKISWMIIVYDILGVLLFSCYIVFDTQLMLGEWGGHKNSFCIDDYCMAALQLYLDIVNLFLLLLELFGDRR
mmetsp:Transcript_7/g.7  ORF Transcript_7/g.7 Transcript_7/m.7 type:complete len:240 (+) Transcript_7:81-800(+)|eukprot:CAMPEP_0178443694 /NCGR_PEP_ID=MMETSP0689_2-20121128/39051_1 /TAXON_ID=160604 /ORGANISM="Amphidinium massartii, Strain CS-259" /LENGTH=239 /DNA_ID=CAMNT_0020067757 /DNA_START=78 /DNA_END=793 /DNA_ORIENTATION=-